MSFLMYSAWQTGELVHQGSNALSSQTAWVSIGKRVMLCLKLTL